MTTTVIKSIKPAGGGDYTSLNDWESANRANLTVAGLDQIRVAEVYSGGNALTGTLPINSATWVTDSTHYIVIRAATGHEHTGVYSTTKAYLSTANAWANITKTVHFERLQMKTDDFREYVGLYPTSGQEIFFDSCFLIRDGAGGGGRIFLHSLAPSNTGTVTLRNCIAIDTPSTPNVETIVQTTGPSYNLYNCTIYSTSGRILVATAPAVGTSENCYFKVASGGVVYYVWNNHGTRDATSNAEATLSTLRSIPYSTATFQNVTAGFQNFRLTVSSSNKLLDSGVNLSGSGVTTDIIGTARPQFGSFDIGAFENDIPICWNYTAQYKNSTKLFKASGCGSFPKTLKVPSNVDTSTGRMVDDGIFINPDEYKVV